MNALSDYTARTLLLPQSRSATAAEVIAELAAALNRTNRLPDQSAFVEAVMAREQMSPTSLPIGWATPHARLENIPQLSFAMARVSRPLSWHPGNETPVHLIWLFAVPEGQTKAYLNLIASVARLSQDSLRVQQLLQAAEARAMFAILEQVSLRRPLSTALASRTTIARSPG